MYILILLFLSKVILFKIIKYYFKKLEYIHYLSTFLPFLIFGLYYLLFIKFKIELELFILINLIYLIYSYILVNIPGAYITSIRMHIFKILINKNNLTKDLFFIEFNDNILFENRFNRLVNNNIIKINNYSYKLTHIKIILLMKFVKFMKFLFKFLNKY